MISFLDRTSLQAVIYLLMGLLLLGCAHETQKPQESVQKPIEPSEQQSPAQAPTPRFNLLAPTQLGDTPLRLQRLAVSRPDQKHTLLAQWQVHTGHLSLEALTPLGLPLLSLTYTDHQQLSTKTYIPIPEGLSAERVIADLQWAYWPIPALSEALQAGYHIRQAQKTCAQGHHCRQLWYGQQLISEVDYLDQVHNTLVIVDHQYGYQLHISTLTVTP
ncbi:DUF3261 domain-containing protein [Terasakiispira papahanaumokuakeensis]|nr:DUF3261 domain-containing protein [Terasakiispira papahanaumokuakeensis]